MSDPINRIPVGDHIDPAPFGYHPGTTIPRKAPPRDDFSGKGVCRYCGQTGLVWEMVSKHTLDVRRDHWILCEMGGKRHQCPKGTR